MGQITLPESMERDRQNNIKANSVHVDNNFNTLLNAVNNKIDKDGTMTITGNIPMSGYKITTLGTPTASGDATSLGWVMNNACMLTGSQTVSGDKNFTGTITAPTQATSDNSGKVATTKFVLDILKAIYPVGAIYLDTTNSGTCPIAALFGTWTLVATDRALWGGNAWNGNSTIAAGLPDTWGQFWAGANTGSNESCAITDTTGVFRVQDTGTVFNTGAGGYVTRTRGAYFRLSWANSTYGNSATVQPPAYRVNVWRRTA